MSFTVFLGNLPTWVTADDIKGWLTAENLVADAIKVIRNPETQESKGFAFIEAPNTEEMNSIIRRFDRAPLEDRLLRANPAQPARPKGASPGGRPMGGPGGPGPSHGAGAPTGHGAERGAERATSAAPRASHTEGHSAPAPQSTEHRPPPPPRRAKKTFAKRSESRGPQSSFAEELAKAL
jgi:RNA recognition motif-containing protein